MFDGSAPKQNLPTCIVLMVLSGFVRVISIMVLAYPDYCEQKTGSRIGGERFGGCLKWVFLAAHLSLLVLTSALTTAGTFYGPISFAFPIQTASILLWNIIFLGIILEMRSFDKSQQIGTLVVFLTALSLVDVGPEVQDDQDILKLLESSNATVWTILFSVAMCICLFYCVPLFYQILTKNDNYSNNNESQEDEAQASSENSTFFFLVLLVGTTTSQIGMGTSGKALSQLSGVPLMLCFGYFIFANVSGLVFSIASATACEQGVFTPAASVAHTIANMLTGIIIWEDAKVMDTWTGYVCALVLMCLGIYLLSEMDLLENFHQRKVARLSMVPFNAMKEGKARETYIDQTLEDDLPRCAQRRISEEDLPMMEGETIDGRAEITTLNLHKRKERRRSSVKAVLEGDILESIADITSPDLNPRGQQRRSSAQAWKSVLEGENFHDVDVGRVPPSSTSRCAYGQTFLQVPLGIEDDETMEPTSLHFT